MAFNEYEMLDKLNNHYKNADERADKVGGTWMDYANGTTKTVDIPPELRGGGTTPENSSGIYGFDELSKKFGFKDHGDVGENFNIGMMDEAGETGDGTFQLGGSDKAYLTESDWEKHRNSDETWKLYEEVYGAEAAAAKREGNEEGLSASAFDGLMDKAYKGGEKLPVDESIPETMEVTYEFSQPVKDALERSQNYKEKLRSGYYTGAFTANKEQKEQRGQENHLMGQAYGGTGAESATQKAADFTVARAAGIDFDKYKHDVSGTTNWEDGDNLYSCLLYTSDAADE